MSLESYKQSLRDKENKTKCDMPDYRKSSNDIDYAQNRAYDKMVSNYGYQNYQQPTYIIKQTNSIGTAGFVLSLLSMLVPFYVLNPVLIFATVFLLPLSILGSILYILGFLFSFIGLFKRPKGLAIAGFIISIIALAVGLIAPLWIMANQSNIFH